MMSNTLNSYVGIDTLTKQIENRMLRRGFQFNVMVVGQTGLGKSTLINTLFASHLMDSMGRTSATDEVRQTTTVHPVSHSACRGVWREKLTYAAIVENGVKLHLNLIDTPGYGDLVNNEHWCVMHTSAGTDSAAGSRSCATSRTSTACTCARS